MGTSKWTPTCGDDSCRGWHMAGEAEINRCDECVRFETDHDAFRFAVTSDAIFLRMHLDELDTIFRKEVQVEEAYMTYSGMECAAGYTGETDSGADGFILMPLDGNVPLATATLDSDGNFAFVGAAQ